MVENGSLVTATQEVPKQSVTRFVIIYKFTALPQDKILKISYYRLAKLRATTLWNL